MIVDCISVTFSIVFYWIHSISSFQYIDFLSTLSVFIDCLILLNIIYCNLALCIFTCCLHHTTVWDTWEQGIEYICVFIYFQFFIIENDVCCGVFTYDINYVKVVFFYAYFVDCFLFWKVFEFCQHLHINWNNMWSPPLFCNVMYHIYWTIFVFQE